MMIGKTMTNLAENSTGFAGDVKPQAEAVEERCGIDFAVSASGHAVPNLPSPSSRC